MILTSFYTSAASNRQREALCVRICRSAVRPLFVNTHDVVASLGWVTPGAATEGVTPLFFPEKPGDLFCSSLSLSLSLLLLALGCHLPRGCHPTPFLPVRPRFSTILCKFAHKFFSFGCHPPGGCHPGRSAPPESP